MFLSLLKPFVGVLTSPFLLYSHFSSHFFLISWCHEQESVVFQAQCRPPRSQFRFEIPSRDAGTDIIKINALVRAIKKGIGIPLAAPEKLILLAEDKIKASKAEKFRVKFRKCADDEEKIELIAMYIRRKDQNIIPSSVPAHLLELGKDRALSYKRQNSFKALMGIMISLAITSSKGGMIPMDTDTQLVNANNNARNYSVYLNHHVLGNQARCLTQKAGKVNQYSSRAGQDLPCSPNLL